jgi:hypothetical protein
VERETSSWSRETQGGRIRAGRSHSLLHFDTETKGTRMMVWGANVRGRWCWAKHSQKVSSNLAAVWREAVSESWVQTCHSCFLFSFRFSVHWDCYDNFSGCWVVSLVD